MAIAVNEDQNLNQCLCVDRVMSAVKLRKRIAGQLRSLSEESLQAACHFIEYLNEQEDNPATLELLRIKGFRSSLRRAERQLVEGKTTPFAKVRRDV
jgi:hypothetical protein